MDDRTAVNSLAQRSMAALLSFKHFLAKFRIVESLSLGQQHVFFEALNFQVPHMWEMHLRVSVSIVSSQKHPASSSHTQCIYLSKPMICTS